MCRRVKIVTWRRPWCKLSGNFLYAYPSETAKKPTSIICLEDAHIAFVDHSTLQNRMRFGFQIFSPINQLSRVFYAESESDRERWCRSLRKATRQFCFEDFYTVNGMIGEGKFANVYSCIRKRNNQKCAVKIINKYGAALQFLCSAFMDVGAQIQHCCSPTHALVEELADVKQYDRDGLRTEIAVLQFVHHPHVVHLKNVFETRSRIYIVMTLVEGGDLFQHLKEHGCCTEEDAWNIMIQILHAVLYLHERGIVHRDLKPENIMLVSRGVPANIQVVDFGLSKFIAPEEIMNEACGTQFYLAPEVLRLEGYGREVDIWSADVILYVMLSCHFPFPVKSMKQYLDKALKSEYSLFKGWDHVSEGTKSLIRDMLNPSPRQRITISQALQHPWIS